ncbi:Lcl C-terminal domain-containing protein [Thiomicrolovo sp. ZZH C-3]
MKTVGIFLIAFNMLYADYIRDDAAGIVTDNNSGLMWQDDTNATTANWQNAIDRCEALTLGGFDDWRMPNQNELRSLVDFSRDDPAIDPAFKYVVSDTYWSSTSSFYWSDSACTVFFKDGADGGNAKDYNHYYVRCVRGGY